MRGHPHEKTSNRCAAHRRKDADLGLKDTIAHANDVTMTNKTAPRSVEACVTDGWRGVHGWKKSNIVYDIATCSMTGTGATWVTARSGASYSTAGSDVAYLSLHFLRWFCSPISLAVVLPALHFLKCCPFFSHSFFVVPLFVFFVCELAPTQKSERTFFLWCLSSLVFVLWFRLTDAPSKVCSVW